MRKFDLYVTSIPNNNAKLIIARHIASLNHSIPMQTAMSMAEKPPLLLLSNMELKDAEQHVARLKRSGIGFKVVESKTVPPEESDIFIDSAARSRPPVSNEEYVDNQPPEIISQKIDVRQNETSASASLIDDSEQMVSPQKSVAAEISAETSQPKENKDSKDEKDNSAGDKKQFVDSAVNYERNIDMQESVKVSLRNESNKISESGFDDKKQSNESTVSAQKNGVTLESAKISQSVEAAVNQQKNSVKQESTKNEDDKRESGKKPVSDDDKKQPGEKSESAKDKKQSDRKLFSTKEELNKFKSGIRIGRFQKAEQAEKKSSRKQTIIVMSVFITIAVVLFLLPKEKNFAVKSADAPNQMNTKQEKTSKKEQNKKDGKRSKTQKNDSQNSVSGTSQSDARREVTTQQRHQANAYVDSARTLGSNPESIIAFYKLAISFNPQNLAAWQGLLQAYRDLGMDADARSTEEQMRKLFGERVESINLAVKPFGELIDTYINDGTYRVEYRSSKRSKDDITRDVFLLTRAVRTVCSCENISIYASTGTGKGLLSHSSPGTSVHSLSDFSNQAQIVWLE